MEIWRKIPDWPQYGVSNFGGVKRFQGLTADGRVWPEKVLKTGKMVKSGRAMVALHDGKRKQRIVVARLVLLAFEGPPPAEKPYACHKNDDRMDDSVSNLKWGSHKDNTKDAIINDKWIRGERHGQSKLTPEQVLEIRDIYSKTKSKYRLRASLARRYGVSPDLVQKVAYSRAWRHI